MKYRINIIYDKPFISEIEIRPGDIVKNINYYKVVEREFIINEEKECELIVLNCTQL